VRWATLLKEVDITNFMERYTPAREVRDIT
jgi:hypothetical protein